MSEKILFDVECPKENCNWEMLGVDNRGLAAGHLRNHLHHAHSEVDPKTGGRKKSGAGTWEAAHALVKERIQETGDSSQKPVAPAAAPAPKKAVS